MRAWPGIVTPPWRRATAAGLNVVLAMGLAMGLAAGPAGALPDAGGSAVGGPRPKPLEEPVVHGAPVPLRPAKPDPTVARSLRGTPAVSWPRAGTAEVTVPAIGTAEASAGVRAGDLPVSVGALATRGAAVPGRLRVELLDRAAALAAGVTGVLLRVRRADGKLDRARVSLKVDYTAFRHTYGGDWASRLRLLRMPAAGCAACRPSAVSSRNDVEAGSVSAEVEVAGVDGTFAVTAGPSGATGDYRASSLSPTGSWQVSANSGNFAWSYPLDVPETPGGLVPELGLSYSSGSVDGRTASTNAQPSWAGEGWELWPGFIERSYRSCSTDGVALSGDLCWAGENATMSFAGHSSELVRDDATGVWRPKHEDGSRVEQLFNSGNGDDNGEYWKVTTPDGVQYVFGRRVDSAWNVPVFGNNSGEPCNQGSFDTSSCTQAWRWNLDSVVDPHQNTITYFYAKETNSYGLNHGQATASYDRGGYLLRAEYGTRVGGSGTAPAKVVFDIAERCVPGSDCTSTQANFPDVPLDQNCVAAPCPGMYSPTFWTTKRLAKVTGQVWDGAAYRDVDSWTFDHRFPDPGDGTSAALWLDAITHTGLAGGSLATPKVTFTPWAYPNRVNSVVDGWPPMEKFRIINVKNESGGETNVVYAGDCVPGQTIAPDTNTQRCFPVNWTPQFGPAVTEMFHKYVVSGVTEVDRVGGNKTEVTDYEYVGGAAWRYNDAEVIPPDKRTWTLWRGYQKVVVRHGDGGDGPRSAIQYQYFRGMDGDRLAGGGTKSVSITDAENEVVADLDQYAGLSREVITYDGSPVVSATVNDPWSRGPTATHGSLKAFQVEIGAVRARTALASGGWRRTRVDRAYNDEGLSTQVNNLGDMAVGADDRCTTTTYARNTSTWLLNLPSRVETVGVACTATPSFPDDAISDERSYYDGSNTLGAAPTAGDVTKTEELADYAGGSPSYVMVSRAGYDTYGRVRDAYDALDRKTSTAYTPATGLPTSVTVTNPRGDATTTALDAARGQPVVIEDANGRKTELAYDALGRLAEVWLPGRGRASGGGNQRYRYGLRADGPSWVATDRLTPRDTYVTSYGMFDGLLRSRQTQATAPGGGRALTDTFYDSRGLVAKTNDGYHADGAPGTSLLAVSDNAIHRQTVTQYDGAERVRESIYRRLAVEQWRASTSYGGDRVHVTPPLGGTPTSTVTDARGRTTELQQYSAGTPPTGAHDTTLYSYKKAGQLSTITDPAGNRWSYGYDLRGRKTSATDPDKGTSTATYDNAGQLMTRADARGKALAYEHDVLGRKTAEHDGSPTGPVLAQWAYDSLNGGKGLLASATRYHDGNAYTTAVTGYEPASGRPTGTSVTIPAAEHELAGTYTTSVVYRADGSLSSVSLPGGGYLPAPERVVFDYDGLGLPYTIQGAAKYVTGTWYTAFGEVDELQFGVDGHYVSQIRSYDIGTRRLTRSSVERQQGTTYTPVEDYNYSYDPAGNVTRTADKPAGATADVQCYRYDYLRRLATAWTPAVDDCSANPSTPTLGGPAKYWTGYTYDLVGNRKTETQYATTAGVANTVRTYTYPDPGQPRPHTLSTVTTNGPTGSRTDSYNYDSSGNTTTRNLSGSAQTLDWDAEGNLDSASATGGGETNYVYDADGNRLIRRDPASTTLYLGGTELRRDNTTGAVTGTRYYSHTGGTVAVRTANSTSSVLNWLTGDHHGTATTAINASTGAVTRRRLDPFGNPRGTTPAWPGERGFVGGAKDTAVGLTHLGAREYDTTTGRFTTDDPITNAADPQQINGSAYANNNPTTRSDPDGLLLSCSGPDGVGCRHPVSREGYTGPDANTRYEASRTNYLINQRKANTWKPQVGPVQGKRPVCNGFGSCMMPKEKLTPNSPGCFGREVSFYHPECNPLNREWLREQEEARRAAEGLKWQRERWDEAQREARLAEDEGSKVTCSGVSVQFIVVIGYGSCSGPNAEGEEEQESSFKIGLGPGAGIRVSPQTILASSTTDTKGLFIMVESGVDVSGLGYDASASRPFWGGEPLSAGFGPSFGLGGSPVNIGFEYHW